MNSIEENFCTELQALLDKYKTQMSVPRIMGHAQHIFHHTLSIRYHPELHPYATELDYLNKFITEGPKAKYKYAWVDELNDVDKQNYQSEYISQERDRVSRQPDAVEVKLSNLKEELMEEKNFYLLNCVIKEVIKLASTKVLLQELKDRRVIDSWYYNGAYHVGNELPK